MANVISDETIEYVGILAKLELSDEDKENAKKDMASMLDYIVKLGELDTEGIEPMSRFRMLCVRTLLPTAMEVMIHLRMRLRATEKRLSFLKQLISRKG